MGAPASSTSARCCESSGAQQAVADRNTPALSAAHLTERLGDLVWKRSGRHLRQLGQLVRRRQQGQQQLPTLLHGVKAMHRLAGLLPNSSERSGCPKLHGLILQLGKGVGAKASAQVPGHAWWLDLLLDQSARFPYAPLFL